MLKRDIRKEILRRRDGLDAKTRAVASLMLAERIIGHQWFYCSDTILVFVSYGSEIDTTQIIEEAFRTGKKVYVPKVEGEKMDFYRIQSMEDLAPGYKGILEPSTAIISKTGNGRTCPELYEYAKEEMTHTLMIMPGVAFDPFRNRIGYGKGFYDKYLADKEELKLRTIAVGFRCQEVDQIPTEESDVKPYQVILV